MINEPILKATHQGELKLGDNILPCAVLEDGMRVLSQGSVFKAFGRPSRGPRYDTQQGMIRLPSFVDANNLKPYLSNRLIEVISPITYLNLENKEVEGYNAEIVPLVCDAYLAARMEKVLTKQQEPLAITSEILVRSLSQVGIVALVDEATGYQSERDKFALHKLLEKYIAKELLPWTKTFPDDFYQELFRLRGWEHDPLALKRPKLVGKLTNEIVYRRLPYGILDELAKANPKNESGHRSNRHHQFLTHDVGHPHLEKHLISVITLMRISPNWRIFERHLQRAHPKLNEPFQFDLFEEAGIELNR